MSRQVTHDGRGVLQVRFPFDRSLVDRIKTLPHRRWNASERYWWVPDTDVVLLVDLLAGEGFSFDAATREHYGRMGGTLELAGVAATGSGPTLPGLFDVEPPGSPTDRSAVAGGEAGDYTVARLNERVRAVIESAFPTPVWLVGEISGFNKNAHRKHVSFELTERTERGDAVSKIPATLFDSTRRAIERELRDAGEPFRLEDEVSVRLRVRVELYVPWGQYRVVVDGIDVRYTLGEAARRREEIIRCLTESGLAGRNPALPIPPLPLRIGLITSLGSDAYNDVLRSFQESGFAFRITAHGARVQAHATEPSVLNALDWFRARADRFDVVLICRGGGSRTDLIWFDSMTLGETVATFPLPVVVGIGHEQDQSVLDAVARSCKTPTAAAGLLVEAVRESLERVETAGQAILEMAARRVGEADRASVERARRLTRAARTLVRHELASLGHRSSRTVRGATTLLATARENLARWSSVIPRYAALHVVRQRAVVKSALRAIQQGARRDIETALQQLDRRQAALLSGCSRRLTLERERSEARAHRLQLVHPRRVVERGYAILRGGDGSVLTRARLAPRGSLVRAELRDGSLKLRSEGEIAKNGGE